MFYLANHTFSRDSKEKRIKIQTQDIIGNFKITKLRKDRIVRYETRIAKY